MKKRTTISIVLVVLSILIVSVGITVAYLVSQSGEVENSFTIGNVSIELTESPSERYLMLPGTDIPKDPLVTVNAGSDACWLFFEIEKSPDFDKYMTYLPAEGWIALPGETDVYYRTVDKTETDTHFMLLAEDKVSVKDTVTEEELDALTEKPYLTFASYAIQRAEIPTAESAWELMMKEMEEQ